MGPLRMPPREKTAPETSLPRHTRSWPPAGASTPFESEVDMTPPPTPPTEKDAFNFSTSASKVHSGAPQVSAASQVENETTVPVKQSSGDRPASISLPSSNNSEEHTGPATWLDRALRHLRKESLSCNDFRLHILPEPSSNAAITAPNFQIVAQAMPGYAGDTSPKQIFEAVVSKLQEPAGNVPNITITHVFTSRVDVSLKDAPVSPPATPNASDGGSDYFNHQRTFTNIARIRDYHSIENGPQRLTYNVHVAPPNSVHVSLLERYLPPTTRQEFQDFFSLDNRSYLVDRLTELQDGSWGPTGGLLLVYPTLAGARTFKTYYKDPILDPLLRRIISLRGLTTRAGEALGRMDALDVMMDFDDMQSAIERICRGLEARSTAAGRASHFTLEHAERIEVVLEKRTWIQQFIAQESSRMKQDLIDYQKSGQRMPAKDFEASPAALAREVEDGIRNSTEASGGIGIEMGVYVIRRALV
ncbi:uncharacterized protein AB675_6587 [Cyphellophora attinorum]|uniref:Uncharacterized protein n=1 Tax=Cyphellophora attinorum TaxID=1664694 RepID=A0A0N1HFJ4_9EURO|nr:uncharacterized protein AB675_6587 [Phialophora attinorum]KPI44095.1 hypothetical protein AB675_6587 [Phialophora attinorum]